MVVNRYAYIKPIIEPSNLAERLKERLFMPCYVDSIYPKVGIATLDLLEKFGLDVIMR